MSPVAFLGFNFTFFSRLPELLDEVLYGMICKTWQSASSVIHQIEILYFSDFS